MDKGQGRLAVVVVEAVGDAPGAMLVEVTLGDRVITIGDRVPNWPLSDTVRQLASQLIGQVKQEYEQEYEEHNYGSRA